MGNPTSWRHARRTAAALADEFVLAGFEMVVVEGTFWTNAERDEFVNHLATDIRPRFVTLHVSIPEALRRVAADFTRDASRDPAVLTSNHVAFAATLGELSSAELVVDTATATPDQVAALLMSSLQDPSSSGKRQALFRKLDCLQIPVPDVEAGLAFLSRRVRSRVDLAPRHRRGLADRRQQDGDCDRDRTPGANLTVRSADAAADAIVRAGGNILVSPFDIAIGRCAVTADPWGNRLVIVDTSKGLLMVDPAGRVLLDAEGQPRLQAE